MSRSYHLCTDARSVAKLNHQIEELRLEPLGLYLAPARNVAGVDLCPAKSHFCELLCLYNSGLAEAFSSVNQARIKRTELFRDQRDAFLWLLCQDFDALVATAERNQAKPVARPNCTSDIMWEHIPVHWDGESHRNIFEAFPTVQFYDYTKLPGRITAFSAGRLPANYHLTFSLSEDNDRAALRALDAGLNVAVPMHMKKGDPPSHFSGYPVINGDQHDFRFLDPPGGHIVALSPKGRAAKKDHTSGFIKQLDYQLDPNRRPDFPVAR